MVDDRLRRLKTGAIDETKKLFGIFIYLWVLLSLFSFHKALVLNEEYLLYDQGFALINSLVLAKVVLIGEFFRVGDKLTNKPLIYPIIFKSAVFAVLLICFHIFEGTLTGVLHGKTLFQSIPSIGGGTLQGILMVGIIMFVALMPFFAFRELDRAIGTQELHNLLFGDATKAGAAPPVVRRGWRITEVAALILALGAGWLIWSLNRGTSANSVAQKPGGPVVRPETASGVIGAAATTPVGARVSGVIQELECGANMRVKAGQLCAKIDPRPYQLIIDQDKSDLAEAEARFAKDKAVLAKAKAAFERFEALAKRRAVSQKAIDRSRKAYDQAEARTKLDEDTVARLQAALKAAETNLDYTNVVAPVDGTVVSRTVEIGQTVTASSDAQPLFLIATDPSTSK
jgi:biotin carboxyl carrier protein